VAGCTIKASGGAPPPTGPSGPPGIVLAYPFDGGTVALGTDSNQSVPVAFTVSNFTLKAPGTCSGASGCGHVHVQVDGNACNAPGQPYNNAGAASPINALMALCSTPTGVHTLQASLHNDDHSPVLDSAGHPVASGISFVACPATGACVTLSLTSPLNATVVTLGTDAKASVPASFSVTGFTLAAPGSCAGAPACGHVHLLIDGASCNTAGQPYNNAGPASPLSAQFATCATAPGPHQLSVELHNDDHTPVLDGTGKTIASSANVYACPSSGPCIAITSPPAAAAVSLTGDSAQSVPITYGVANFLLRPPGTCAGAVGCGHVHVLVDGAACNAAGQPYNNASSGSPTSALLSLCANPVGQHTVTLELHNDDHSPVLDANGNTVQSQVSVVAAAAGTPVIQLLSPLPGSTVLAGTDPGQSVPLSYATSGFILRPPGTCSGAINCGHVHVLVDGTTCNSTGNPYNNASTGSPAVALLSHCPAALGGHDFRLELHNDDHSPVLDAAGRNVQTSARLNVVAAATPGIGLTAPLPGSIVVLGADSARTVPVSFAVTNFALSPPGTCPVGSTTCGHVHVLVDGAACNASNQPYNVAGAAGPLGANLSLCADPSGPHLFTVELHHDDHSPVLDPVTGLTVASSASITTCAAGAPCIGLRTPNSGDAVLLTANTAPMDYAVSNFTLSAPGTCDGGTSVPCGHVHILVDGAACNAAGQPYNNAGTWGPTAAFFSLCATPTGAHRVTAELHHNDHSPVLDTLDGGTRDAGPVQSALTLTTQ